MFRKNIFIIIFIILFTITGCGTGKNISPEKEKEMITDVCTKYLTEAQTFNYQTTKELTSIQYATEEFKDSLTQKSSEVLAGINSLHITQRVIDIKLTSPLDVSTPGFANVTYKITVAGSSAVRPNYTDNIEGTLYLKKVSNKWLVNENQQKNENITPTTALKNIILGEKEESQKIGGKIGSGWTGASSSNPGYAPLLKDSLIVVLFDYPGMTVDSAYQQYFKDLITKDKSYINVKIKGKQTLVYIKGESKEQVMKLVDLFESPKTEMYKTLKDK